MFYILISSEKNCYLIYHSWHHNVPPTLESITRNREFPLPSISGSESHWFPFQKGANEFFSFPSRSWTLEWSFFICFMFPNCGARFISFPSECEKYLNIRAYNRVAQVHWCLGLPLSMGKWFSTDHLATVGRILIIFLAEPVEFRFRWNQPSGTSARAMPKVC